MDWPWLFMKNMVVDLARIQSVHDMINYRCGYRAAFYSSGIEKCTHDEYSNLRFSIYDECLNLNRFYVDSAYVRIKC